LPLVGISRFRKLISEREKPPSFGFFRLEAGFDQIHKNSIGAGLPRLGDGMHVFCDARWEGYTLTNWFFQSSHAVILHHFAPKCIRSAMSERGLMTMTLSSIRRP